MPEQNIAAAEIPALAGTLSCAKLIETANAQEAMGQRETARQLYRAWIDSHPDNPQLHLVLFNGSVLESEAGNVSAAVEYLKRAVLLKEDFLPGYINLGRMMERVGAKDKAVALWKTALGKPVAISGDSVGYARMALTQMARVLNECQQTEMAEDAVRQCLEIDPNQKNLIEQYLGSRLFHCQWPVMVPPKHGSVRTLIKNLHPLSAANFTDDPLLQLAVANRTIEQADEDIEYNSDFDRRAAAIDLTGRRLRVGYVSSDLREHAIGYLMADMFERHDRSKVEVFAYYCGEASTHPLHARIKAAIEHWVDIRAMSDDEAARRIAADGIDILVDVNGHTKDARTKLFARRPAPVQINWLGFPGTMGSPYHNYIIADDWIVPPESELYYSETVLRLPCYQPNDRKREIAAERPQRSDTGLPDDAFVFCCFNGSQKLSRYTFDRWMQILARVPGSVLWLLDTTQGTKLRLAVAAQSRGIDPARLIYAPKKPSGQHLARYPLADLCLDTVPYGAHTTASDALWMGVPVLTLSGRCFASRVCGSLVRAAGLPDMVCTRPQDFVERAVELGNNRGEIAALKDRLAATRDSCTLFDTDLLVERLETLYATVAREHNAGRTPRPDLTNLRAYLEAGASLDHEQREMLAAEDYFGLYREKLTLLHRYNPLPPDNRLWTKDAIAAADAAEPGVAEPDLRLVKCA
jgi:predicted O-linked N-acetylglucosamine transferase (SPINDLY family)